MSRNVTKYRVNLPNGYIEFELLESAQIYATNLGIDIALIQTIAEEVSDE